MKNVRCIQQGIYCEISATIRYDFSFDGYLHLRWLRNYGGRVHVSLYFWSKFSRTNGSLENK